MQVSAASGHYIEQMCSNHHLHSALTLIGVAVFSALYLHAHSFAFQTFLGECQLTLVHRDNAKRVRKRERGKTRQ